MTDNCITIAHVVLSLEIGGMESVIAQLATGVDSKRFRTVIICLQKKGAIGEELSRQGIKVILADKMTPKVSFLYPKVLIDLLKKEQVDIVHTHSGCWHKTAIAALLAGTKGVVYTEHGRFAPDLKRIIYLDRVISKITSTIIPVSHDLFTYLKTVVKIPEQKLKLIENGIDTDFFSPAPPDKGLRKEINLEASDIVIGCIARLAAVKDHITLVDSFFKAKTSCPHLKMILVGDGPEQNNIEKKINKLGLSGDVILLGARRDIREILSVIDIFILSSISEGTSITLLEAMSVGKAVVATAVGGNNRLITDGVNGCLVPARSPDLMAERIIQLARSRNTCKQLGAKAREYIKREFSIRTTVDNYQTTYTAIYNPKPTPDT